MKVKKTTCLLVSGLLLAGMLTLSGCGNSGNTAQQATFSTVQKGEVPPVINNPNNPVQMTVVRNEVDWATLWNLLYTNYSTKPALPVINFNESVIVAVVDAPRPSGGYSITINTIQPTPSGITVNSSQISPGQDCFVTLSFTQPFHIVAVPTFSGAATFELSQSVHNCGQQ